MRALKCYIEVTAGILLDEPEQRLTRRWEFTSKDLEVPNRYSDDSGAAMNYAMQLQNPQTANWVKVQWVWL